jgi:hypothetical protein
VKRLFWIGVGAVATVVVIRKVGALIDNHTPPGVAQAVGVVTGLRGALRAARTEFSAGLSERETELRHELLGDVDLDEARTRTETRRAQRTAAPRTGRHADDLTGNVVQDADDGELGYSFY